MLIVILSNITNSVHLPLGSPEYSCYLELFTIFIYKKKKILRRNGFDMIIAYRMFTALCILLILPPGLPQMATVPMQHFLVPRDIFHSPFRIPPGHLRCLRFIFGRGKPPLALISTRLSRCSILLYYDSTGWRQDYSFLLINLTLLYSPYYYRLINLDSGFSCGKKNLPQMVYCI